MYGQPQMMQPGQPQMMYGQPGQPQMMMQPGQPQMMQPGQQQMMYGQPGQQVYPQATPGQMPPGTNAPTELGPQ